MSGWARVWERLQGWQPYDPAWLVALAQAQHPDRPELADALADCTRARGVGTVYLHFVSSRRANQPGAEWQFDHNLTLEDAEVGDVLVDVLADGRIGGIELVGMLTR